MLAPVAGYVFDGHAGSIRAVVGVPGAASAGDRLPLSDSLSAAFLHPSLPLAAGLGKDGSVVIVNWNDPISRLKGDRSPDPRQVTIAPRFGAPDRIVFALNTDQALFVSAAGMELWSGLTSAPIASYSHAAATLGGSPRSAALSSDGSLAAVVLDSSMIVEASASGLRPAGEGRSVIYAPALIILGSDGTLSDAGGNTLAVGLESDSELAQISGFHGLVVLSRASSRLSVIDSDTSQLTAVDCGGCKPAWPQTLSTSGMLYFEDAERGGLLLDRTSATPRIVPVTGIDGRRNQ